MLAETYIELLKDPNHLFYELTLIVVIDGLLIGLGWPFVKRWIKRHDRVHHEHDCEDDY